MAKLTECQKVLEKKVSKWQFYIVLYLKRKPNICTLGIPLNAFICILFIEAYLFRPIINC